MTSAIDPSRTQPLQQEAASTLLNNGQARSSQPEDDADRSYAGGVPPPRALFTTDGWLLMAARFVRLFSYGWLAVALFAFLVQVGLSQFRIGALFTATVIGDLVVTLWLSTRADAFGRRTTLLVASLLKVAAGTAYAYSGNFWLLLVSGFVGIISPTGGEIGPFLAIEQAALSETIVSKSDITRAFGYYQLVAYVAQALGALVSGATLMALQHNQGWEPISAYRFIICGYASFGIVKFALYWFLSADVEPLHTRDASADSTSWTSKFGLHRAESKRIVFKLSLLFVLDAFAGGFVMQTFIVYFFAVEYAMDERALGSMLFVANLLSGLSALAATPLVEKIGAINTMVVTHLPSNILLLMVPFMPTKTSAVVVLLLRFSISQMDVPARQSYVATVVAPDERSAAGGITSIVRGAGLAVSPLFAGLMLAHPDNSMLFGLPFVIAGVLKTTYDLLLYWSFRSAQADADTTNSAASVISTNQYAKIGVSNSDQQRVENDTDLYDEEQDFDQRASRR